MISRNAESLKLPVIDVCLLDQKTAEALVSAATNFGFVYIKSTGSGIGNLVFQGADGGKGAVLYDQRCTCGKHLLIISAYIRKPKGWLNPHGFLSSANACQKGDPKEAFNFGEFLDGKAQQELCQTLRPYEAHMSNFSTLCRNLCLRILRLFAMGLKIDPRDGGSDWFAARHDVANGPSGTITRILYYPHSSQLLPGLTEHDIRAGAHSDYGSLTLLFRLPDQPGLEIQTPDNTWAPVPVTPSGTEQDPYPPILVNIGDLLSHWTGGVLKSTVHRVVFPREQSIEGENREDDRYSIAYFFHPCRETALVPVPSPMVEERQDARGRDGKAFLTANEHLQWRLSVTYGWDEQS